MPENIEDVMHRVSEGLRILGRYKEANICALFADLAKKAKLEDMSDIKTFTENIKSEDLE